MKKFLLIFVSLLSIATAAPRVVVTIKPIHALVCGLMKGVATPDLLIDGAISGHTYALKPNDRYLLDAAQVIIWVGPSYETHLAPTLKGNLANKLHTLTEQDGIVLYANRAGELWEAADHHHHSHTLEDHHAHDIDGHIWLAPNNARVIVGSIANRLRAIDPEHAQLYTQNEQEVLARLDNLASEILALFRDAPKKPYILFHDFTQYFDRYFGTTCMGALVTEPDCPSSPHHLTKIVDYLQKNDARLFAEPQFDAKIAETVAKDTRRTLSRLDAIGADLDSGEDLYFDVMRRLANALV